jgi:hypothetical protein
MRCAGGKEGEGEVGKLVLSRSQADYLSVFSASDRFGARGVRLFLEARTVIVVSRWRLGSGIVGREEQHVIFLFSVSSPE